jgi:hypothetical protein
MDSKTLEIYILFLKKNAYIIRFTEYNAYYEFQLEWRDEEAKNMYCIHPEVEIVVQRKLFAMNKIRRHICHKK